MNDEPSRRHPARRLLIIAVMGMLILAVAFPWILAKTTLRDRLLSMIVNDDSVSVQSRNASFGYLTPLSLSGLQIASSDQSTSIEVNQIEADKSWLGMLVSRPELGTIRFVEPKAEFVVQEDRTGDDTSESESSEPPASSETPPVLPNLAAEIRDASVVVRSDSSKEPTIDLDSIGLTLRLQREEDRSVLRIDPSTLFDHEPITPALCGRGLQLVAPLLADEIDAEGAFSLKLSEFQLPVGRRTQDREAVRIAGQLELHQATVSIKNTVAANVVGLVIQLIGGSLPDTMIVAKDVAVDFRVVDGRIHHEGLALLLPHGESNIGITSSGSVGIDESLDLNVAIQLPASMLGKSRIAQRLSEDPIEIAIGGTLQEPKVGLPQKASWVQSIERIISADENSEQEGNPDDSLENAVIDLIGGLLERAPDRRRGERTPRDADGESPSVDRPILDRPILDRPIFNRRRDRQDDASSTTEPPSRETEPDPNAPDASQGQQDPLLLPRLRRRIRSRRETAL